MFTGALAALFALVFAFSLVRDRSVPSPSYGVTFSPLYARQLGLDAGEAFTALLDDAGVRRFRIPVYWSEVQPSPETFRWEEIDWLMGEAAKRGAEVALAVGYKVPRWPECYIPDWAETGADSFDRDRLLAFLQAAVERYREAPALARWQVENEPYLSYGVCPSPDPGAVAREVELVRSLDAAHPVVMTVSGELQRWGPTAATADLLGFSVYRVTWNRFVGHFHYPLPPWFYRARAALFEDGRAFISELQAEPWFSEVIANRTAAEWAKTFTADDLRKNVAFAARTGVADVDLWGAEWWYFLWKNGEPGLWEAAREVFAQ